MRSFIAVVALLLASALSTGALFAYLAHETVLDPERAGEVLSDGLDSPEVRTRILARAVPGYANLPEPHRAEVERAAQSRQVDRALSEVDVSAIYFHVFEAHLRLQREENDFSAWIREGLKLPDLADQMKALNPYLGSLERVRSSLLNMCDDYLLKTGST